MAFSTATDVMTGHRGANYFYADSGSSAKDLQSH